VISGLSLKWSFPRRGLISREVGNRSIARCAMAQRDAKVSVSRAVERRTGARVDDFGAFVKIESASLVHVSEFRDECIESRIGPGRGRLGPIVFAGLETAEMRMLVLLARAALPRDGPGCDGACIYSDEITLVPVLSDEDIEVLFIWMER
jgi:hypothetical protein